jgi:hypothetical protein
VSLAITPLDSRWTTPIRDFGAVPSAAILINVIEKLLSLREQKKTPQDTKKGTCQTARQEANTRGVPTSSLSFKIDISLSFFLTESAPPPRVDTRDAAIAKSGVATLDRVAVSDKKMKMMYITWGREH